jgi:hypothetical protein
MEKTINRWIIGIIESLAYRFSPVERISLSMRARMTFNVQEQTMIEKKTGLKESNEY